MPRTRISPPPSIIQPSLRRAFGRVVRTTSIVIRVAGIGGREVILYRVVLVAGPHVDVGETAATREARDGHLLVGLGAGAGGKVGCA